MKEIVSVSVTRTSDAVVNLKKVASLDSSRPLMNLFKWAKVSPSAAVRGVALRREITLTLVGSIEEYSSCNASSLMGKSNTRVELQYKMATRKKHTQRIREHNKTKSH